MKDERRKRSYYRHHEANKDKMRDRMRGIKEGLVELLGGRCMDCGFTGPQECFHFDHRNPWEKSANIQALCSFKNRDLLWEEIQKCDLVCANCHAIRTARNPAVHRKQVAGRLGVGRQGPPPDGARMGDAMVSRDAFAPWLTDNGYKQSTAHLYTFYVSAFLTWWASSRRDPQMAIGKAVDDYRLYLRLTGAKDGTIKSSKAALRAWRQYLDAVRAAA